MMLMIRLLPAAMIGGAVYFILGSVNAGLSLGVPGL